MSYSRPLEAVLLAPVEALLLRSLKGMKRADRESAREGILGLLSSKAGGYRPAAMGQWLEKAAEERELVLAARDLLPALERLPIPIPLALAALSRPDVHGPHRKEHGAFYTDFRLAQHLARGLRWGRVSHRFKLLDPACGSGILLAATVLEFSQQSPRTRDFLLSEVVHGMDLSARALRGAAISLCSMTSSAAVIRDVIRNLRRQDSLELEAGARGATLGFDAVIANPPWEKMKVTRHEWLQMQGHDRHYGAGYGSIARDPRLGRAKRRIKEYAARLGAEFRLQGKGEADLYKLFLELSLSVVRPGGAISLLVPAGLIRSHGTRELRASLMERCSDLELDIFDNKPRFFEIDSRFKFVAVRGRLRNGHPLSPIRLAYPVSSTRDVKVPRATAILRTELSAIRPDLSIPEVRSLAEWRAFRGMATQGAALGDPRSGWGVEFLREVDMTQDRRFFKRRAFDGRLPLLEGRMVHQYAVGVKQYASGTGRRAVWKAVSVRHLRGPIRPQFYFPAENLPLAARERVSGPRVGFCDISGQTNERTMIAAMIPQNLVCGNKVPTLTFGRGRDAEAKGYAWLAIANSIPFDWLLRRVVTTTINFFHLKDIPFPRWDRDDNVLKRMADIGKQLSDGGLDLWRRAELRAEADLRALLLYGTGFETLQLMLKDFPLLDRAQPPLPGDRSSSITKDYLLLRSKDFMPGLSHTEYVMLRERVKRARVAGAIPYIPSFLCEPRSRHDSSCEAARDPREGNLGRRRAEASGSFE